MQIEYQIKRIDLIKVYFYSLRYSPRTRFIVLGSAAIFFAYVLYERYSTNKYLALTDYGIAFLLALGLILAIPAISFVTAKTQMRTLSIHPEGIRVKLASKEGVLPWKSVESILATPDRIIITGKSANIFSIPASAFSSEEQRQSFIDLATSYHSTADQ